MAEEHHHHARMDSLPRGCDRVSADVQFTVRAGTRYALDFPGQVFGMQPRQLAVPGCSRIAVTFINEDSVRHQWMVHGLPRYLFPGGMFHLEAMGGETATGSFIVPADDRTYLLHCDMAQHMEMGMKGQLVVAAGSGNLWNVAGVSDTFERDDYLPAMTWPLLGVLLLGVLIALRARL